MARCCDPRGDIVGTLITRNYRLGGMGERGKGNEVVDTLNKIDGVKSVEIDKTSQGITVKFDPGQVPEDHLISTLNSLGHSILNHA
ncbi:MAG: heavy-metal-associated domain-containing protein [Eubacteriales bacterium]